MTEQSPLRTAPINDPFSSPEYSPPSMGLFDHLRELRRRLVIIIGCVVVGTILAYLQTDALFHFLAAPFVRFFPTGALIGTGPAEAFIIRIKAAAFGGLLLSIPVIFWQVWGFIKPGLYEQERKIVVPLALVSTVLFFAGAWLSYYFVLPLAFEFFNSQYQELGLTPQIRISEHISVVANSVIALGLCFEMPIICLFLARLGLLSAAGMISGARYAVVGIFILAAVATPPDVISQVLVAGPLCLLYLISYLVVRCSAKD